MATPADDPRLGLARRIYERTGDRQQVIDGMTGLGYGKAEAVSVVDQVVPAPAAPKPASTGATSTPAPRTAAKGSQPTTSRPTSRSVAGSPAGRGLFAGRGRRGTKSSITPTLSLPRRPGAGDVAGFGAGLVLYVLVLNYIKHGPAGVTGWLGAKFLNRPFHPDAAPAALDDDQVDEPGLVSTRPAAPTNV